MEAAAKTWSGDKWWTNGGGNVWDAITYDETTGLVLLGTCGALHLDALSAGLYSSSIVAVRAETGEYAWHYQTGKHVDGMPVDSVGAQSPENFHIMVSNLTIAGKARRVVMTVPRFGGFFLLDAKTGELISLKLMADRPESQKSPAAANGAPRSQTGHNWWPMSYNPVSGLVYVPAYDDIVRYDDYMADAVGRLIAWDPIKQVAKWSQLQQLPNNGGVLSTAGNLVFQGEGTGEFHALAADSGRKLWSVKTGSAIQSIPVTYTTKGEQYILIPVGFGSGSRLFAPNRTIATPEAKRGPSRLLAFKVGATTPFPYPQVAVPRVPKPPAQTANAATIKQGAEVAERFRCMNCHGQGGDGSGAWLLDGAIPDLRYMTQDAHQRFMAIVLAGMRRANGMPGFADGIANWPITGPPMTGAEAMALQAHLVDLQWKAYNAEQAKAVTVPAQSRITPHRPE